MPPTTFHGNQKQPLIRYPRLSLCMFMSLWKLQCCTISVEIGMSSTCCFIMLSFFLGLITEVWDVSRNHFNIKWCWTQNYIQHTVSIWYTVDSCRYTVIFRIYDWHKYILICQIIFVPWFAILPPQVTQYPNFESRVDFTRPLCFPILSRHPEDEVFHKPERFNLTNEMQCLRGFGRRSPVGLVIDITCGLGEIWGNSTAWLRHFAAKRDQTSTIARHQNMKHLGYLLDLPPTQDASGKYMFIGIPY